MSTPLPFKNRENILNLENEVNQLKQNKYRQIVSMLSVSDWYRVAYLGETKGSSGLATIVNIYRRYNNDRNEAMVLAITVSSGQANIKNLSATKGTNLITKARVVYDTDQKVYLEIFYNGNNDNYTFVGANEVDKLKLLDFEATNSEVTVLAEENLTEHVQEFVVESMGCGGNWNNKLVQPYNSICTISANSQELGIGAPTGVNKYGTLITLNPRKLTDENYSITQIYIPSNPENYGVYIRKNNKNWLKLSGTTVNAIT